MGPGNQGTLPFVRIAADAADCFLLPGIILHELTGCRNSQNSRLNFEYSNNTRSPSAPPPADQTITPHSDTPGFACVNFSNNTFTSALTAAFGLRVRSDIDHSVLYSFLAVVVSLLCSSRCCRGRRAVLVTVYSLLTPRITN